MAKIAPKDAETTNSKTTGLNLKVLESNAGTL